MGDKEVALQFLEAKEIVRGACKVVIDDITLAKALMELKSSKPKADKVVIQEPEQGTTTTIPKTITAASSRPKAKGLIIHEQVQEPTSIVSSQQPSQVQDKGKGKMVKPEHRKTQQIKEVNIAWDDVQAKINADYELAQRLQAEEQEELSDAEKVKLFMQFLEKRRKFFTAKRAGEKRNKPPTRAQ
nr:hypothetical protein [Tanacetum cinerariifolium]GEY60024.1 hypothetical protein [Tanacetum cinerariifolium]